MLVTEIMEQAKSLSQQERKELIKLLVDSLEVRKVTPKRHLSELRGLGKAHWTGIDAQEYINQLRSEWDERP